MKNVFVHPQTPLCLPSDSRKAGYSLGFTWKLHVFESSEANEGFWGPLLRTSFGFGDLEVH